MVLAIRLSFVIAVLIPSLNPCLGDTIADLTEKAEKSVVRINVSTGEGDGLGSGFVVDSAGIIVTNCHVMAGARTAEVIFADNRRVSVDGAYLLDPARDIAIIRISANGIPSVAVSPQLPRKGEAVIAIGAPLGFDFTVTRGIVSAIRTAEQLKEMGLDDHAGTWIQTDVAISQGNSGGPIFNESGEVIAMTTMFVNRGQNLNFGISCVDITAAIAQAKMNSLKRLSDSSAKVAMPESGEDSIDGMTIPKVPKGAVGDYVEYGKTNFDRLFTALKKDIGQENLLLKDLRSGSVGLPFVDDDGRALEAAIVHRSPTDRGKWYFRSERVKTSMVDKQLQRIRLMTDTGKLAKAGMNNESLLAMLYNAGPPLDTRMVKTVGFIRDATVLDVFGDRAAVVAYDKKPYLAILDSTAGLYPGDKVLPAPFYVLGTLTAQGKPGDHMTFTCLQQVSKPDLSTAIGLPSPGSEPSPSSPDVANNSGSGAPAASGSSSSTSSFEDMFATPADGSRVWTSRTGHQIKAILLSKTTTHVKLKRSDNGSIVDVPISQLSEADQSFLKK